MRILYIGSVKFSYELLKEIIDLRENIVGIVCLSNSKINSDFCNLLPIAEQKNIDALALENINSFDSINWIKNKNPDIIFCFGWSRILKKELLEIPKLGVLGFHPSLLPLNKGRHPIIWALVLGLEETGSTFFLMDENVDTGDIVSQERIGISYDDDAFSLYKKIESTAKKQIKLLLPKLKNSNFKRIKQEKKYSNSWRKRSFLDGVIDWRMSSLSIHNLVKALTKPYTGASFKYMGKDFIVWKTLIVQESSKNQEPGKVLDIKRDGVVIKTGNGAIKLLNVEPNVKLDSNAYL